MPNSINKNIAFFQKCESPIFQNSLFISKRNKLKKADKIFTTALAVLLDMQAFEQ